MKITLVSESDIDGGAAKAAYRLQKALRQHGGVQATMRVARKNSDDHHVFGPAGKTQKLVRLLRSHLGKLPLKLQKSSNTVWHSVSCLPSNLAREFNAGDADVVNLHWVCGDLMSVADIGRLAKPVVWTLHDCWAFSGAEHYPASLADQRYVEAYSPASRNPLDKLADMDRWTWQRKRRHWRPMSIAAPSSWLADCARRSALMADWEVRVIPNALPVEVFRPWDKTLCREMFGLGQDEKVILFGALGGGANRIKGMDLLLAALQRARGLGLGFSLGHCTAVVFGQSEPAQKPELPLPVKFMGRLHDDQALAMLYAAADVAVVPSRLENLPQVATEALACGTPVVGFRVGGMPDVVDHRINGYLANPYDTDDLAHGIEWVLADARRHEALGAHAREKAVRQWSPETVARQYLNYFAEVKEKSGAGVGVRSTDVRALLNPRA